MSIAVRELSVNEINEVAGGVVNEAVCIATATLAGGLVGAGIGAYTTAGFGAGAGFTGGARIGGLIGGLGCAFFFS
jgi:hypothetical protein